MACMFAVSGDSHAVSRLLDARTDDASELQSVGADRRLGRTACDVTAATTPISKGAYTLSGGELDKGLLGA